MKTFFTELFQYNQFANKLVFTALAENPEKESGNSIKFLSHIINVHQIWNDRIQPRFSPAGAWEMHAIQDLYDMDTRNHRGSMQILDDLDLDQIIQYANTKGKIYQHTVGDLLFQIINHSTYHRGQIALECRQNGIEPVLTDYISFKWS